MNSIYGRCYNYGFKYSTRVLWSAVSCFLFWRTYEHYRTGPEYVYLYDILGPWLCLARGSAAVLNLNLAAVLLPMCHILLFFINKARKVNSSLRWMKIETKSFHIFIGYLILIMTGLHVSAHVVNISSFCDNFNEEFRDLNPFPFKPKVHNILFGTVTGITGLIMTPMLIIIFVTSLKIVRRRAFNTFWYCHRIFVLFYLLVVIHGIGGPLRKQINIMKHVPGCHRNNITMTTVGNSTSNLTMSSNLTQNGDNVICSEGPKFGPIGCETWIWVGVPLLLYLVDVMCRRFRREHVVGISNVQLVSKDVFEVSIINTEMEVRPGQYMFVNCQNVSTLEWHPFSVVQVPTELNGQILKFWIKVAGDWTEQFLLETKADVKSNNYKDLEDPTRRYPSIKLDGPYNSPMENISKYKTVVCIAGGVGITPFLSHVLHLADESGQTKTKLKKLHLIIVGRDEFFLRWVDTVIQNAYIKLKPKLDVDIQLFYTGKSALLTKERKPKIDVFCIRQSPFLTGERCDTRTGSEITTGRPSFKDILAGISSSNKRSAIGVFACGPAPMCSSVAKECNKMTSLKTKFVFQKETF